MRASTRNVGSNLQSQADGVPDIKHEGGKHVSLGLFREVYNESSSRGNAMGDEESAMTVTLILLVLSALIGLALGSLSSWVAVVISTVVLALPSAAILRVDGFGVLAVIAIVVGCLTAHQLGYLIGAGTRGPEEARERPSRRLPRPRG
jgi:hypothetical protein